MQALPELSKSSCRYQIVLLLFSLLLLANPFSSQVASAQAGNTSAEQWEAHLSHLSWRNVGPAVTGGRIVDFAVLEENPSIIYAATASSGVWKSATGGHTWFPVFEKEDAVALGGIAVAPANPNVVWVGTGEPNARNLRSTSWGRGVYKSEDGGESWHHMGLEHSQHIGRIVIHPDDPNTVWVSVLGSMWTHQPERNEARGLWRTTDGGENWTRSLWIDENTGVVEVVMDPRDPDRLYAGAWQRERKDWRFFGTGPGSGLFRSEDGGDSWTRLTNGLPETDMGRPGLSVCRSQPDRVYAILQGADGGLYRTDNRGASWEKLSTAVSSSMYYGQVRCHPTIPDRVYVLGTRLSVSEDGGRTFRHDGAGPSVHVDHHALWINPNRPEQILLGNDGGIYQSEDDGESWRFAPDMPLTQFYNITADLQEPFYYVYGGTQDNNSLGGPSGTRNTDGVVNADWFVTVGGDGFWLAVEPENSRVVYTESQYGRLVRFDALTGERRLIQPQPRRGQDEDEEVTYRWNWSAPVLISPHEASTVYFGAQFLFRSTNRGDSWETISPDLTRQVDYGPTNLISPYGTIRIIAESPHQQGVLAVGTDDGLVQLSRDAGETWTEIGSFPGVPELSQVVRLVLSAHDPERIYVALSGHEYNDFAPYLLKSDDFGDSWTSISEGIPTDEPIRAFAADPAVPNLLFVGTEFGVYGSLDGGSSWLSLQNDLPTVPIHDMVIQPKQHDLVLGTHGRGIWILDQIDVLRELSAGIDRNSPHIFAARPGLSLNRFDRGKRNQGDSYYRAPNPPDGVILDYWIPASSSSAESSGEETDSDSETRVRLEILDSNGDKVRRAPMNEQKSANGLYRWVWDMRHEATYVDAENEGRNVRGPKGLSGAYRAQLVVGADTATTTLEIVADPAISLATADREYRHSFQLAAAKTLGLARSVVGTAGSVTEWLNNAKESLKRADAAPEDLRDRLAELSDSTSSLARRLSSLERTISGVYGNVGRSTALPTQDQESAARWVTSELEEVYQTLRTTVNEDLPALSAALRQAGAPEFQGFGLILPSADLPRFPAR